jgi:hypothetical protein
MLKVAISVAALQFALPRLRPRTRASQGPDHWRRRVEPPNQSALKLPPLTAMHLVTSIVSQAGGDDLVTGSISKANTPSKRED